MVAEIASSDDEERVAAKPAPEEEGFTEMEAGYMASLIKEKSIIAEQPQVVLNIAKKGKTTIRLLASSMIAQDTATEKILSMYEQVSTADPDKKKENAIKLLLRCKKMFDARNHARRILALIIRRETTMKEVRQTRESVSE